MVPQTTENFKQLCQGVSAPSGQQLSYQGTTVTRAIPNLLLEAGHVQQEGGVTIYGNEMMHESYKT